MSGEEYRTLIDPEFAWVALPSCPHLIEGQVDSLENTIEIAHRRVDQAVADCIQELNVSGSQANPEMLAERIWEVKRRRRVLAAIAGLQVALGAAGKS